MLEDGLFSQQTPETFKAVCKAKIFGIENLDKLTRERYHVDWFIAFSSLAAGFGNIGQSNYAYANSYMERVIEQRQTDNIIGS